MEPGKNKKIKLTKYRRINLEAQKKHAPFLAEKGWEHDGLWFYSPYTGYRYTKSVAMDIEELRAWGATESAYLNDKNCSTWSVEEEKAYAVTTDQEIELNREALQNLRLLTGNPHISLPPKN